MSDFAKQLDRYLDVILRVGLNIQPGQTLRIGGAPLGLAESVRSLTRKAYDLGAGNVYVDWRDDLTDRMWFDHATDQALVSSSPGRLKHVQEHIDEHAAFAYLTGNDPDALAGVNPERLNSAMQARSKASEPLNKQITGNKVPWCIAAAASPEWARKVFPDKSEQDALAALWAHILHAVRADTEDPIATWEQHISNLHARRDAMNREHFASLRYRGPGTDLTVGLPATHRWLGGSVRDSNDIRFVPNLPTEEVFLTPQRDAIDGIVSGTMPVMLFGTQVEGVKLRLEGGRIVEYSATKGADALKGLIETDDGSHYLGEAALVTSDSPTFATFPVYSTLFDENVTCHIAIGTGFAGAIEGGSSEMSTEERLAAGVNVSATHWDFMVGSPELEIDGITADGRAVPIIRQGAWLLR